MAMSHPLLFASLSKRSACALVLASATITALAVLGGGGYSSWPKSVLGGLFYAPLAINAWIDARRHVLLKNWTHLSGVVALVGVVILPPSVSAIMAALAAAVPMLAVTRMSGGRLMGAGDARLIAVLALWNSVWYSWGALAMLVVSFAMHALYVSVLAVLRRVTLSSRHALGPWLVGGSWLVFVFMA